MTIFDLAALDPAAEVSATALFTGAQLVELRNLDLDTCVHWYAAWSVVVEIPQADGRAAPADDLIRVAVNGARSAQALRESAAGGSVTEARPREWKGSLPKAICHLRLWQALSDTERALLGGDKTAKAIANACNRGAKARWKKHANHHYSNRDLPTVSQSSTDRVGLKITHDILDAVALGLWYLGRLNLAAVTKG